MRLSEERLRHLSHLILDELEKGDYFEKEGKSAVLHDLKRILFDYFKAEDQADDLVRQKIHSLSRPVPEGSREWEILYGKFLEEELKKKGLHL